MNMYNLETLFAVEWGANSLLVKCSSIWHE